MQTNPLYQYCVLSIDQSRHSSWTGKMLEGVIDGLLIIQITLRKIFLVLHYFVIPFSSTKSKFAVAFGDMIRSIRTIGIDNAIRKV